MDLPYPHLVSIESPPVIISSSITGLFISISLSKAEIPHVLIGGNAPGGQARLGESVNQTASIDFWKFLGPKYSQFCTTKSHISLMISDLFSMIYLGNPKRKLENIPRLVNSSFFNLATTSLIHVDRVLFDEQVYQDAIGSKFCHLIQSKIELINYSESTDRVNSILLENGEMFSNPRMVFDATGVVSLVAKSANLKKKVLSEVEKVVWTHLNVNSNEIPEDTWWKYGTNLLRLEQATDGLQGISWLIPLKERLSVGVSLANTNENPDEMPKEQVMDLLLRAYDKRGIQISKLYRHELEIRATPHQYYLLERACGANWMLAGNTFISIWYPSSSGLATSMYAALMAPGFVKKEEEIGKNYEDALLPLVDFHWHIDQMIKGGVGSPAALYKFWSIWVSFLPGKLSKHLYWYQYKQLHIKLLKLFSKLINIHYFVQLSLFGFAITAVSKRGAHGTPQKIWPLYFHSKKFLLNNYIKGFAQFLKSKITP